MTIATICASKSSIAGSGEVISVTGDQPVRDVVALLSERRIGAVPVMEGDAVAGIFSERDVVYGLAREGEALLSRPVAHVMTAPAITVTPAESVIGALSLMTRRRIRHLPVVDHGALVGFVSIGDLVKHRIDRIERESEAMRAYIQQA